MGDLATARANNMSRTHDRSDSSLLCFPTLRPPSSCAVYLVVFNLYSIGLLTSVDSLNRSRVRSYLVNKRSPRITKGPFSTSVIPILIGRITSGSSSLSTVLIPVINFFEKVSRLA